MASRQESITTDVKMELDSLDDHPQSVNPLDHHHHPVDLLHHHQPEDPLNHHQQPINPLDHHQMVDLLDQHNQLEDSVDSNHYQPKNALEQQVSEIINLEDYKYTIYNNAEKVRHIEKVNDVQSKLIIAKNILQICKHEVDNEENNPIMGIDKLHHYTKQPLNYLNKVIEKDKSGTRSFKQACIDTNPLPPTVLPFIYDDVRDIFIEYYVEKMQLPTETLFLQSLNNKRENGFYKHVKISTLVKNNLVKYHYLPKLKRVILSENPEFAYQRHLYLRQIMNFRSSGKNIVYVAVFTETQASILTVAVSSTAGLICKNDKFVWIEDHDDIVGNDQIKAWIQYELLPKIDPSSVVVLTQQRKRDTTPTPFSSKKEMKKWLQKHAIPFTLDSHKAQLYSLVKMFKKNNKEKGFYEEVLASSGFKVIMCPIEYKSLDFFRDIYTNIRSNEQDIDAKTTANSFSQKMVQLMQKMSQDEWAGIEAKIVEEEKHMMSDDGHMQKIIDNLLQMVKKGDATVKDFPEGCHATKSDNYEVHIGDIIVD